MATDKLIQLAHKMGGMTLGKGREI